MKISTNWLKDFITLAPPLSRIAERLTLAGLEVKKCETLKSPSDTLFEIEITSNRPDWLSHWGVAREIAAVENISVKGPAVDPEAGRSVPPPGWDIKIKDVEGCPYYTGVLIEGITETKTPDFIVDRLLACGVRSINLIVDITNYVLFEVGQPLHAFDADLLKGKEVQVRKAKAGEKLLMIDGSSLELKPDDLVIADSDHAVALAGVMGGKDSEITDRTRNVFLESAFFNPGRVRATSRRHQLSSDSSYRFERRVDPEAVDLGSRRALALIKKYAKPRHISAMIKAGEKPQLAVKTVSLRSDDVKSVLGVEIKSSQISLILGRLGLDVKQHSAEVWTVGIPSFRPDLTRPVDLVEEIARIYGFENIPETLPARAPIAVNENPRLALEQKVRQQLSGAGLSETVTFSLIAEDGLDPEKDLKHAVQIVNPLQHGLHWMRPTMVTSLLNVIRTNVNAGGADSVAVFEIANIYAMPDSHKHPVEECICAIALYGKKAAQTWLDQARPATFYDLKGCVEAILRIAGATELCVAKSEKSYFAPGIAEELRVWQTPVAFMGEVSAALLKLWDLKEPVYYAEVSLEKLLEHARGVRKFEEWPKYPAIERDLSIVVKDSVKSGDLTGEIRGLGQGLIRDVVLFDLFRGKRVPSGCKNLAFRVIYQSPVRTLVSDEVQKIHDTIARTLVEKYQASFQS
ncbi:MAG TPA: phenylalanine--tRNA ligase subunit beta [Candidatus Omnitrophota bacterium]|nr:phenylalanine--tRNA ligase subunit beta [Candidatus Omnitrophota bacterium]HPS37439.1 phenylalanine--tRNA ligase subunit beta [Candidatus Omnitrophota bacterium]